jgi:hypothetical protein
MAVLQLTRKSLSMSGSRNTNDVIPAHLFNACVIYLVEYFCYALLLTIYLKRDMILFSVLVYQ